MKQAFLLGVAIVATLFAVQRAYAVSCSDQVFGGGPIPSCSPSTTIPQAIGTKSLTITKSVQRPGKGGDFVHSLGISDAHYGVGQTVPFQIIVNNTGTASLSNIQVVDSLPQYLTFDSGNGKYDSKHNTVTVTVNKLDAGKSQTIIIVGKTAASNKLPSGQGVVCVTNTAKAQTGNLSNQDSSEFCIDKGAASTNTTTTFPSPQVYPVSGNLEKTPPTGPEMVVLPLLSATGALGWLLKKNSR